MEIEKVMRARDCANTVNGARKSIAGKNLMRRAVKKASRNRRDKIYADLGMVKVRGALGGVYYE